MKIVMVSFVSDNRWTGMGKWTYQISESLAAGGHSVERWFSEDFPSLVRFGRLARHMYPFVLAWNLIYRRKEFDAVVIHEPGGLPYGFLRRFWRSLPPCVCMCHNVESHVFRTMLAWAHLGLSKVSKKQQFTFYIWNRLHADGAIRFADKVVCLSTRDWVYVTTRWRRPCDVFRKVNGAAREDISAGPRVELGERVLFVGGWLDIKGRQVLPKIWEMLLARRPKATLSIVGSGQPAELVLADFLPAQRASIRVIPRVKSPAEMTGLYFNHDIFLMPSLGEGSPLALIEAMATGMAVVISDVGGVPDIVRAGVDGLLFPSGDAAAACEALTQILEDRELGIRLAHAAERRARELTWEESAACVEAALFAATGKHGAGIDYSGQPRRWPCDRVPNIEPR